MALLRALESIRARCEHILGVVIIAFIIHIDRRVRGLRKFPRRDMEKGRKEAGEMERTGRWGEAEGVVQVEFGTLYLS